MQPGTRVFWRPGRRLGLHVRVLRLRSRSVLGPALAVQGLLPAGAAFAAGNFDGLVAVPTVAGAEYELA